ncbi:MAG: hypothetical protein GVY24_05150, partial [Planctomycetes bacterium]|nr:hypothetical protein [Planctomycetota bacterium]
RRPEGVAGATVFTHVGNEPPADTGAWQFATNTGSTVLNLNFEASAQSDTVWLTAFWFNTRKESGPAATPISVNLPAAQSVPQGAKLKIAA